MDFKKTLNKDPRIERESFTKFKKNISGQHKQSRLRKYKKVWIILGLFICIWLILFFLKKGINKINFSSSDNVQVYLYYSRGSRDNDKKEQYDFTINDPIQVKIDFKDMQDGDIVVVSLKKAENEEVKQSVEVPVSGEGGSRFISVSPLVRKEAGKYKIEVSMNVKEKIRVLEGVEFEIR